MDQAGDGLTVRVVAGRFRGRRLFAPKGLSTRPTIDRAREACFQILGDLDGLTVVDFFAGTGALGIEALSRGARHAIFVEIDRAAIAAIRRNQEHLGIEEESTIISQPVDRCRSTLAHLGPLDLVLADPPWRMAQQAAEQVAAAVRDLLSDDARVVLGHPASEPVALPAEAGLTRVDIRKYGGSGLSFFEKSP